MTLNNLTYEKTRLEYILSKLKDPAKRREFEWLGRGAYLVVQIKIVEEQLENVEEMIFNHGVTTHDFNFGEE